MDFRCKTKEFERQKQIFVKIVADPGADESKWLPACAALARNQLITRSPQKQSGKKMAGGYLSVLTGSLHALVLSVGQVFMVTAAATACGSLAAVFFGQSYDRVMYHCGPQDTIVGVLSLVAIPFFWVGWFLPRAGRLRLTLLLTIGLTASCLLGRVVSGFQCVLLGVVSFFSLFGYLYTGSYIATWKGNWPRKFKPTLFLSLSYIAAVVMLAWEFVDLDLAAKIESGRLENVWYFVGTLAGFALLPAFITALSSGTKRYASALGLAMIAQLPLTATVLIYCLANMFMLFCFSLLGPTSLSEYFARTAPAGMPPDFDLSATNQAELLSKVFTSLIVWVSLIASLLGGSILGVLCNRIRTANRLFLHGGDSTT